VNRFCPVLLLPILTLSLAWANEREDPPAPDRPLTLLLPLESIPASGLLSAADFRARYPGIELETGIPFEDGWYLVYRHAGLTYFFGPEDDRAYLEPWESRLRNIVTTATEVRPQLESARIFIYRFSLNDLFEALARQGPASGDQPQNGEGTAPGPEGGSPASPDSGDLGDGGMPPATNGETGSDDDPQPTPGSGAGPSPSPSPPGQMGGEGRPQSRPAAEPSPTPEPPRLGFWERLRRVFRR
jgi:hypothetical protein